MTTTEPVARRGRPATITRDEILDVVVARLHESWTVPEVAAVLGVSVSAVYYHFRNKQEILAAVGQRSVAELKLPGFRGDWRVWLRDVARADFDHIVRHPFLLDRDLAREIARPAYWQRTEEALLVLQQAGFSNLDAFYVLEVLTAAVRDAAHIAHESSGLDSIPVPADLPNMKAVVAAMRTTTALQRLEAAMDVVIDGASARCKQ